MTPTNARPSARRNPVRMNGTVEGTTTVLKTIHSDAPKLLAAFKRLTGVVLIPSRVLIRMENTAPRKMMPSLEKIPIPNQMITSGSRATRGVAFMAFINGSKMKLIRLYQPTRCRGESRQPQPRSIRQETQPRLHTDRGKFRQRQKRD